jgi:hypothetical protein
MKKVAIIGANGMVGQNLVNAYSGDCEVIQITRDNICNYKENEFDLLFVTAADARKYLVNNEPYDDLISIMLLLNNLRFYKAKKVILISTVDVYNSVSNIGDEHTILFFEYPSYGSNRLLLEFSLKKIFPTNLLIVRLQGLIADNLKKNLLFDIKNGRTVSNYSLDSRFQFYPLKRLRQDLNKVLTSDFSICNLSAEPVSVQEINSLVGLKFEISNSEEKLFIDYNVKSKHPLLSESNIGYWINKTDVLFEIECYLNLRK